MKANRGPKPRGGQEMTSITFICAFGAVAGVVIVNRATTPEGASLGMAIMAGFTLALVLIGVVVLVHH